MGVEGQWFGFMKLTCLLLALAPEGATPTNVSQAWTLVTTDGQQASLCSAFYSQEMGAPALPLWDVSSCSRGVLPPTVAS